MKSKTRIKRNPTKAIRELEKISTRMRGKDSVLIGLPKGSNDYPDGTSVIMVGLVHEFGSPSRGVPERSFLRSTMIEKRREYRRFMKRLLAKVAKGEISKQEALSVIGLKVESDVKDKLIDIKEPELKHRDGNPLFDTGHLLESITHVVE